MFDNIITGEEHIKSIQSIFGDEIFDNLFYQLYGDCDFPEISIEEKHRIDAINQEGIFKISNENVSYYLKFTDGNWDGSQITEITKDDYEKEQRFAIVYRLKPKVETTLSLREYNLIKNNDWFLEMERKINYDYFHSPTSKIINFWEKEANSRGMIISQTKVACD